MRTESFEGLVGRALIGDPKDRDVAECRIVCKLAAMNGITCECGDILDQKHTVLFERDRVPFKVCCHRCAEKLANVLKALEFRGESNYVAFTWNGTVPGESYVSAALERERKKERKAVEDREWMEKRLPRAKSFQQIITPKDASDYAVAKSQQLYDAHNIVTDGVIIIHFGSEPKRSYKRRDVEPVDATKIEWFREQCEGYLSRPSVCQVMTIGRTDERVENYHCCRFNPLNENAAPSVLVDLEYVKTAQNLLGKLYWTYSENNPTLIQGVNKKNAVVCAIALIRQN